MHVGVVGNCQVHGVGLALAAECPSLIVDIYAMAPIAKNGTGHEVAQRLGAVDLLLINAVEGTRAIVDVERLKAEGVRVFVFPAIAFTGFQPDMIYLNEGPGQPAQGPLSPYHSAIVAACFALGFSPERTESLFNSYVYAALGYFEEFAKARQALLSNALQIGFELSAAFDDWLVDGPFMHTINHPKMRVLSTIADMVVRKTNLPADPAMRNPLYDKLALHACWPTYPEIAERLKLTGSLKFKQASAPAQRLGGSPFLTLEEFISASFKAYAAKDRDLTTLSQRVSYTASVLRQLCCRSSNYLGRYAGPAGQG